MSWENLKKTEGVLGRLTLVSYKTAIMKRVWRLASYKDTLCVNWFKNFSLSADSIWTMRTPPLILAHGLHEVV